jgi:hypothetical protein
VHVANRSYYREEEELRFMENGIKKEKREEG